MNINLSINLSIPPDGVLRIKTYDETAPALADATKDYADPSFPLNATVNVPSNAPHVVKIYDSPGDSDDGTLLFDFLYDPSYNGVEIREDEVYKVGSGLNNAPEDGDTSLVDASLKGYDYDVEIRGTGTMIKDTEITIDDDGGFSFVNADDKFYNEQVVIVHFAPRVSGYTPSPITGVKFIEGYIKITADKTLDLTHYNKMIDLASATSTLTITLPALNTVPSDTKFFFMTNSATNKNTTIKTTGTDKILWGAGRTKMYMGQNEQLWLYKGSDGWLVIQALGNFDKVGMMIWSDFQLPGTLIRNGALLNRAEYPRLFNDYVSELPPAQIKTELQWSSQTLYQGYCTLGNGTTTFRIMNSLGIFTRSADMGRGIDTGRVVGSYQDDEIKAHDHDIYFKMVGGPHNDAHGGGLGRVDLPYEKDTSRGPYTTEETGGEETRGKNEARIPLIIF